MASAPDRISVKRRRDDDVVDFLTLANNKKQRTSDHYFVRLGRENVLPLIENIPSSDKRPEITHQVIRPPPGVPIIGTTRPGDEIKDFQRFKTAQDQRNGISRTGIQSKNTELPKLPPDARRFHLTRDLSLALRSQSSGSIRKPKSYLRPHLPTFVERSHSIETEELASHAAPPIDRIIKSVDGINHKLDAQRIMSDDGTITKEKTATFQKPKSQSIRNGQSIQDDPATWDLTSDRLADELMILAIEMDPDAKASYQDDAVNNQTAALQIFEPDPMLLDGPADYVYETYIRVQQKSVSELEGLAQAQNLGYLVIDEDEEDLWEQYLRDDDDDDEEWDEEDGDSNAEDNPRNDYPEDEVSSDDEYGRNIYQYRRDHSDDEQFDQEYH